MKSHFLFALLFVNALFGFSQLRIDTSQTADELIRSVLLQSNSDLIIENVIYRGSKASIGAFENETKEAIMEAGIILSTGNVFDAMGPNQLKNTGSRSSGFRDTQLQSISNGLVLDVASIEFDLIALRDSLVFEYVFASEEYPEYVDKGVNDVFAFFIKESGKERLVPRNIARLPNSNATVSIDNVNHRRNESYFLPSDFYHIHDADFWEHYPDMMLRSRIFEFDGFTKNLKATVQLKEGKRYHLKIAIADVGDRYYDSAVLLKAYSLSSAGKLIANADSIVGQFIAEKVESIVSNKFVPKSHLSYSIPIQFDTDKAEILNVSLPILNSVVELLQNFSDLKVDLVGHTDNVGELEDNQQLSELRANAVRHYIIQQGIASERIMAEGRGESQPISSNQTESGRAANRRVEFNFSY